MNDSTIDRIAKNIIATINVTYTEKGSPKHSFKTGKDIIRLYDNPQAVKRFTAVLGGKDWDKGSPSIKSMIRFDENGKTSMTSGTEDDKLGKPAVFASLPAVLKSKVIKLMGGKYDGAQD